MKTKTVTVNKHETRGRKKVQIKFPNRKSFTVDQVQNIQREPVSSVTIRTRLNELVERKKLRIVPVAGSGRGHPTYIYTLVA